MEALYAARRPVQHEVTVSGRRMTLRLEQETWIALDRIAGIECMNLDVLLTEIDRNRVEGGSLTGAIAAFVVAYAMSEFTS